MLNPLEQAVLVAIDHLTHDAPEITTSSAIRRVFYDRGQQAPGDRRLGLILTQLCEEGYLAPTTYIRAGGDAVNVALTERGRETAQRPEPDAATDTVLDNSAADPTKVMVVHGRDDVARRAMFSFLEAIGLVPLEWDELVAATGSAAPYIGQVLKKAFEIAAAVVVLFTPDDEGRLQREFHQPNDPLEETQLTPQARSNVLFEAGMALGVHTDRTVLVELGKLRPFSDIYGRHVIRIDHTDKPLREIAKRLKTAGCAVSEDGVDWSAIKFPVFPDRSADANSAKATPAPKPVASEPGRYGIVNSLVGKFRIRNHAASLEHNEKASGFRVVLASACRPISGELFSTTKKKLKDAVSQSALEVWGTENIGASQTLPDGWTRGSPSLGHTATFERIWGTVSSGGYVLSGRVTLQLPVGYMDGNHVTLLLDVVERAAQPDNLSLRLSLSLPELHELLHILAKSAIDDIGKAVFPLVCEDYEPMVIGPNYEIGFGDRSLNTLLTIPNSFEAPQHLYNIQSAEINTPEDSDQYDLTARDIVIRSGIEAILRSNEYDGFEDYVAKLSPPPTS
jgi:predicted nucleotide-binding protein